MSAALWLSWCVVVCQWWLQQKSLERVMVSDHVAGTAHQETRRQNLLYADYESVSEWMEGVCKMHEEMIKIGISLELWRKAIRIFEQRSDQT